MVIDPNIKNKLALALDVDDIVAARRSADLLSDYFGVVKVGLELFSAAGPEAIETFVDDDDSIGKPFESGFINDGSFADGNVSALVSNNDDNNFAAPDEDFFVL